MPAKRSTDLWAETTPITTDVEKEREVALRQKGSELVELEVGKGVREFGRAQHHQGTPRARILTVLNARIAHVNCA